METRYYLALGVLLLWIAVRLGIMLYRRKARLERMRQRAEEQAQTAENGISARPGDESRPS
jgi:hypothetical protein